jgi:hypothetical protein
VLGARSILEALAAELRGGRRVDPQGVALAELLLTDYEGPLYSSGDLRALPEAARAAIAALG